MEQSTLFLLAADIILVLHALFVAFVIFGLLLVYLGAYRGWHWVRNPWFRMSHLAAIAVVVLQAWLGRLCPLTILEMSLRERAGDAVYSGSFISHWLNQLLYYQLPWWVFVVAYTLFGVMVVASWWWVRPRAFFSENT